MAFASTTGAVGLVTQVVRRLELEKKYDLKLDVKILDPAAGEKAVLLRQVDAGVFPVITAADVRDKGLDLVVFAPLLYMHIHLVVWNDSTAKSLADLRGKPDDPCKRATCDDDVVQRDEALRGGFEQ